MSDLMQERLDRAERALTRAGFTYTEGAQEWKPPIGPSASPLLDRIDRLADLLRELRDGVEGEWCFPGDLDERIDTALAGQVLKPAAIRLEFYDAGFLNTHGGGDTKWWCDYIRSELVRAYDFYQSQLDGEWADDEVKLASQEDYRELQAQHDQLQSKHKAALDALSSAVKTAEFEGHAHRPWHDIAKTLLADNAPTPEPAPVVPDELDYDVELESGEYDHELDEPFLRGRVQGWNDCRSAMLAAATKPEGAA